MPTNLFRLLGRAYSLLATLVVAALLGATAAATWHFYQEERLRGQLETQGEAVTARVERTDRKHRQVWDALGNFVYVGFTYHGRPYEARCVSDTSWLAAGDRIALRYHAQRDVFGQLRKSLITGRNQGVSRLLNWSVLPDFSSEIRALILFVLTAGALFFMVSGLLASLTGFTFVSALARPVGVIALGALAGFFTYDAAQYYRYATSLQHDGSPMQVVVVHADQHDYDYYMPVHHTRSRIPVYIYDATIQFGDQQRVIPIEEADYERLKAGDPHLAVRYDASRDDFIAVGYSPRRLPLLMPLFFWLVLALVVRSGLARPSAAQPARP